MAASTVVAARLTPLQRQKLQGIALLKGVTVSRVIGSMVDAAKVQVEFSPKGEGAARSFEAERSPLAGNQSTSPF